MWIKDGKLMGSKIELNGMNIYNPTEDEIKAAGYTWVEPTVDTREWVNKEHFINAVCMTVPAEAIPAVLANAEDAKNAIASIALLTSAAAPGNLIDISDPRVEEWLALSHVTVDQVKEAMESIQGGK